MANASDARYWSQPTTVEQRTLATVPPSPPRIHPGSFEITGGINDRSVVVFWQKLDAKTHNGEDFRYTVTDVRTDGHSEPLLPVTKTSTYMEFQKVGLQQHTFFITSENSVGQVNWIMTLIFWRGEYKSLSFIVPGADQCQDCGSCRQRSEEYPTQVVHKNPLSRRQCLRGRLDSSQGQGLHSFLHNLLVQIRKGSTALLWGIPRLGGGSNVGPKCRHAHPQHHSSWRRQLPDGHRSQHWNRLLRSFHLGLFFSGKQLSLFSFLVQIFLELFISLHCFETSVPTSWIWFICRPCLGDLHHHQKPGGRQTQGGFRGRCGRDHRPCQVGILFNGSVLTFDPCRWRLDCQDRIGIVTGYEIVYCSIRDEMDVDKICAGRNLTQEIPRADAEKANLTNLIPWTPYKVERLYIFYQPAVPGECWRNLPQIFSENLDLAGFSLRSWFEWWPVEGLASWAILWWEELDQVLQDHLLCTWRSPLRWPDIITCFFRRIIKLKVWDHGKLLQGLFFKMFVVAGKLC